MTDKQKCMARKIQHYGNNIKTLGKVLNTKRIALNVSVNSMANDIGISKSTLSDFLNGKSVPHPVYYNEIMKYLQKKEKSDEIDKK